jgi:arylsulfatase
VDTRTGVDDRDYQPPFRFNGKIDKLTVKLIPPVMTAPEATELERKIQDAKNKTQ